MARFVAIALALLALASIAFAQMTFSANFQVRRPGQGGAVVSGSLVYSASALAVRVEYPDRNYTEIQKFNATFGSDPNSNAASYNQWAYQTGQACYEGCRVAVIDYSFPLYYLASSYTANNNLPPFGSCAHYSGTGSVTDAWFTSAGVICSALWADGAQYIFDSVNTAPAITSDTFGLPPNCLCAGPAPMTDVVILVDRSASIGQKDYYGARATVRDFASHFDLAVNKVNILIAHYDVDTEVVLEFYQGVSQANIDTAINGMSCSCAATGLSLSGKGQFDEVPPSQADNPYCCARRTSASKALSRAGEYLANGRAGAMKVVIFVTDGKYNTLIDGTPCSNGNVCDKDVTDAVLNLTATFPGKLAIYGLGVGNTDHFKMGSINGGRFDRYCNSSDYWDELNSVTPSIIGSVGCPVNTTFCDPSTCCGLCQCGECMPPTDCEASDSCKEAGLFGGRCCAQQDKVCPTSSNLCITTTCDVTTVDGCVQTEFVCPIINPAQAHCWSRGCSPDSGACISTFVGDGDITCNTYECQLHSDCDDHNPCTIDRCFGIAGQETCSWVTNTCDDYNSCTIDTCNNVLGCQNTPRVCDDGIDCTDDSCVNGTGCVFTESPCDDHEDCTDNICDGTVGHCVFPEKVCPNPNSNCTLAFCVLGTCEFQTAPECTAPTDTTLSVGAAVGIGAGVILGAAALSVGGYVAFKIVGSTAVSTSGGSAGDFAAE